MSSPQEPPYSDPSGNTEAFQAFVRRGGTPDEPVAAKKSPTGFVIGGIVAVIVVALVVWLVH